MTRLLLYFLGMFFIGNAYSQQRCVTFIDGEKIYFDEKIPTEEIEKIMYVRKQFKASIIESCFKGSQFFINENIAKHLDIRALTTQDGLHKFPFRHHYKCPVSVHERVHSRPKPSFR